MAALPDSSGGCDSRHKPTASNCDTLGSPGWAVDLGIINDHLRVKIRQLRRAKSVSSRDAAARAGIPPSSFSSIETGRYKITVDNLQRILIALEADIVDVWPPSMLLGWRERALRAFCELSLTQFLNLSRAASATLSLVADHSESVIWSYRLAALHDQSALVTEEHVCSPNRCRVISASYPPMTLQLSMHGMATMPNEVNGVLGALLSAWLHCSKWNWVRRQESMEDKSTSSWSRFWE
jgi:transcriptional regulator with XRE-family HTH domain